MMKKNSRNPSLPEGSVTKSATASHEEIMKGLERFDFAKWKKYLSVKQIVSYRQIFNLMDRAFCFDNFVLITLYISLREMKVCIESIDRIGQVKSDPSVRLTQTSVV